MTPEDIIQEKTDRKALTLKVRQAEEQERFGKEKSIREEYLDIRKKNKLDYNDSIEQNNLQEQQAIENIELSAIQDRKKAIAKLDYLGSQNNVDNMNKLLKASMEGKSQSEAIFDTIESANQFDAKANYILNTELPMQEQHNIEKAQKEYRDKAALLKLKYTQADGRIKTYINDMFKEAERQNIALKPLNDMITKMEIDKNARDFEIGYMLGSKNKYDASLRIRESKGLWGFIDTNLGSLGEGAINLLDDTINSVLTLGNSAMKSVATKDLVWERFEPNFLDSVAKYFGFNSINADDISSRYFDVYDRLSINMITGHFTKSLAEMGALAIGSGLVINSARMLITKNIDKIDRAIHLANSSKNKNLVTALEKMKDNLKHFNPNKKIPRSAWYNAIGNALGSEVNKSAIKSALRQAGIRGGLKGGAIGSIMLGLLLISKINQMNELSGNENWSLNDVLTGTNHFLLDTASSLVGLGFFKKSGFISALDDPFAKLASVTEGSLSSSAKKLGFISDVGGAILTEGITEGLQGYLETLAENKYNLPDLLTLLNSNEFLYEKEKKQIKDSAVIGGLSGGIAHVSLGWAGKRFAGHDNLENKKLSEAQLKAQEDFNRDEFNEIYKDEVYKDPVKKLNEAVNRVENSTIKYRDENGEKHDGKIKVKNSNKTTIVQLEAEEQKISKELKEKQEELKKEQDKSPNEKSDAVKQLEEEIDELIKEKDDIKAVKKDLEAFEEISQSLLSAETLNQIYKEKGDSLFKNGKTKEDLFRAIDKIKNATSKEERQEAVKELKDIIKIDDNMKKNALSTVMKARRKKGSYEYNSEAKTQKKSLKEKAVDKGRKIYKDTKDKFKRNKKNEEQNNQNDNKQTNSNVEVKGNIGSANNTSNVSTDDIIESSLAQNNNKNIEEAKEETIEDIADNTSLKEIEDAIKNNEVTDKMVEDLLFNNDPELALNILSRAISKTGSGLNILKEWERKFQILSIDKSELDFDVFREDGYRVSHKDRGNKFNIGRYSLMILSREEAFIDNEGKVRSVFINEGDTLQISLQNALNNSKKIFSSSRTMIDEIAKNTNNIVKLTNDIKNKQNNLKRLKEARKKAKDDDKKTYDKPIENLTNEIKEDSKQIKELEKEIKNKIDLINENINKDFAELENNINYLKFIASKSYDKNFKKDITNFFFSISQKIQLAQKDFQDIVKLGEKIDLKIKNKYSEEEVIDEIGSSKEFNEAKKSFSSLFRGLRTYFTEFEKKYNSQREGNRIKILSQIFRKIGQYISKLEDVFNEAKNTRLANILNDLNAATIYMAHQVAIMSIENPIDGSNIEVDLNISPEIAKIFTPLWANFLGHTSQEGIRESLLNSIIDLATLNAFKHNVVAKMLLPLQQIKITINKKLKDNSITHNDEVTLYDLLTLPLEAISKIFTFEEISNITGIKKEELKLDENGRVILDEATADSIRQQLKEHIKNTMLKEKSNLHKEILYQLRMNDNLIEQLDNLLKIGLLVRIKTLTEQSLMQSELDNLYTKDTSKESNVKKVESKFKGRNKKVFSLTMLKDKEFNIFKDLFGMNIDNDIAESLYDLSSYLANEYLQGIESKEKKFDKYGKDITPNYYNIVSLYDANGSAKNYIVVEKSFITKVTEDNNFTDLFDVVFDKSNENSFKYITNDINAKETNDENLSDVTNKAINKLQQNIHSIDNETINEYFSNNFNIDITNLLANITYSTFDYEEYASGKYKGYKITSKKWNTIKDSFLRNPDTRKRILSYKKEKQIDNPLLYIPIKKYTKKEGSKNTWVYETIYYFAPDFFNKQTNKQLGITEDIFDNLPNTIDAEISSIMARLNDVGEVLYIKGNILYNGLKQKSYSEFKFESREKFTDLSYIWSIFDGKIDFTKKFTLKYTTITSSNRFFSKDKIANGMSNKIIRDISNTHQNKQRITFNSIKDFRNNKKSFLSSRLAFVEIFGLDVDKIKLSKKGSALLSKTIKEYKKELAKIEKLKTEKNKEKRKQALEQDFIDKVDSIFKNEEIYQAKYKIDGKETDVNISKLYDDLFSEDDNTFKDAVNLYNKIINNNDTGLNGNVFDGHPHLARNNHNVFSNYIKSRLDSINNGNKTNYMDSFSPSDTSVYIDGSATAIFQNMIRFQNISQIATLSRVYNIDSKTLISHANQSNNQLKKLTNAERALVMDRYTELFNKLNFYSKHIFNELLENKGIDPYIMGLALFQTQMSKLAMGGNIAARLISQMDNISREEIKKIIMPYLYASSIKSVIMNAFAISLKQHNKDMYKLLQEFENTEEFKSIKPKKDDKGRYTNVTTQQYADAFKEFIKNKNKIKLDNANSLFTGLTKLVDTLPSYMSQNNKLVFLDKKQRTLNLKFLSYLSKKYKNIKIVQYDGETKFEKNTLYINKELDDNKNSIILFNQIKKAFKQDYIDFKNNTKEQEKTEILKYDKDNFASKIYNDLILTGNSYIINQIFSFNLKNSPIYFSSNEFEDGKINYLIIEANIADMQKEFFSKNTDPDIPNGIFKEPLEDIIHYIQLFDFTIKNSEQYFNNEYKIYWKAIANIIAPINEFGYIQINQQYMKFFKNLNKISSNFVPSNFQIKDGKYEPTDKFLNDVIFWGKINIPEKNKEKVIKDIKTIVGNIYQAMLLTGEFLPSHIPLYNKLSMPDLNISRQQSLITKHMRKTLQKQIIDTLQFKFNEVIEDTFKELRDGVEFNKENLNNAMNDTKFAAILLKRMRLARKEYYKTIATSIFDKNSHIYPGIFKEHIPSKMLTDYFNNAKRAIDKYTNENNLDLPFLEAYVEEFNSPEFDTKIQSSNKGIKKDGSVYVSTSSSTILNKDSVEILSNILDLFNHNLESGIMSSIIINNTPKLQVFDGWIIDGNNAIDSILFWDEKGIELFNKLVNVPTLFDIFYKSTETVLKNKRTDNEALNNRLEFLKYALFYNLTLSKHRSSYVENINIGTEAFNEFRNTDIIDKEYDFVKQHIINIYKEIKSLNDKHNLLHNEDSSEIMFKSNILNIFNTTFNVYEIFDEIEQNVNYYENKGLEREIAINKAVENVMSLYSSYFTDSIEKYFIDSITLSEKDNEYIETIRKQESQRLNLIGDNKTNIVNTSQIYISKNATDIFKIIDWESMIPIKINGVNYISIKHFFETNKSGVFNEMAFNNPKTNGIYENNEDNVYNPDTFNDLKAIIKSVLKLNHIFAQLKQSNFFEGKTIKHQDAIYEKALQEALDELREEYGIKKEEPKKTYNAGDIASGNVEVLVGKDEQNTNDIVIDNNYSPKENIFLNVINSKSGLKYISNDNKGYNLYNLFYDIKIYEEVISSAQKNSPVDSAIINIFKQIVKYKSNNELDSSYVSLNSMIKNFTLSKKRGLYEDVNYYAFIKRIFLKYSNMPTELGELSTKQDLLFYYQIPNETTQNENTIFDINSKNTIIGVFDFIINDKIITTYFFDNLIRDILGLKRKYKYQFNKADKNDNANSLEKEFYQPIENKETLDIPKDNNFEIKGNMPLAIDSNLFFSYKTNNYGKNLTKDEIELIKKESKHLSRKEFKKYLLKNKERALLDKSLTKAGREAIALSYDTIINLIDNIENLDVVLSKNENEQLGIEIVERDSRNITLMLFSNQKNETALHEVTHAVMEFAFNEDSNEVNNLKSEINKIRLQIQSELENNHSLRQELGISEEQFNYIFKNINGTNRILHEFVATFLTNPKLAEYLSKKKYKGDGFGRFKNLQGRTVIGKGVSLLKALIAFSYDIVTLSFLKNRVNLHSKLLNILSKISEFNTLEGVKQKAQEYNNKKITRLNRGIVNVFNVATRHLFQSIDSYTKNKELTQEEIKEYKKDIIDTMKNARESLYASVEAFNKTDSITFKALHTIIGLLKATLISRNVLTNPIKRNITLNLLNDYRQQMVEGTIFDFKIPLDFNMIYDKGLKEIKRQIDNILSFNSSIIRENEQSALSIKEEIKNIIYNKKYNLINKYIAEKEKDDKNFKDKYETALSRIIYNIKISDYFIGEDFTDTNNMQKILNRLFFNQHSDIVAENKALTYNILKLIIDNNSSIFNQLKSSEPKIYNMLTNYILRSTRDLGFTRLTLLNNRFGLQNSEEIFYNIADIIKSQTGKEIKISNEDYKEIVKSLHKMTTLNAIDLTHLETGVNKDIDYITKDVRIIRDMLDEYKTYKFEGIHKEIYNLLSFLTNSHLNSEHRMNKKRILNPDIAFEFYKDGKNITDKIFLNQNTQPVIINKNYEGYENDIKKLLDNGFKVIKNDSNQIVLQIPSAYKVIDTFDRSFRPFYREGYYPHDSYNSDMSIISLNRGTDNFEKNLKRYKDMGYEVFNFSDTNDIERNSDKVFLKYKGINNYKTPTTQMGFIFEGRVASGKVGISDAVNEKNYLKALYNDIKHNNNTKIDFNSFYEKSDTRRLAGSSEYIRKSSISLKGYDELMESNNNISNLFFNQELRIGKNMSRELVNTQTMYSIIQSNENIKQRKIGKGINSIHHHAIALFSVRKDNEGYHIEVAPELTKKYEIDFSKDDIAGLKRLLKTINYDVEKDGEVIYVDTRMLPLYFGYEKPSVNKLSENGNIQKGISSVATVVRELITEIRNNVIIRNPSLVWENFKSNIIGLIGEGITIPEIFSSVSTVSEQMSEYKHLEILRNSLLAKNDMLKRQSKKPEFNILRVEVANDLKAIENRLLEHPMKKFFDAGFYTNLVQDSEVISKNYDMKIINAIANKMDLSETTKEYMNEIFITSNSEVYNSLAEATRIGDFIPRVIYYNHLRSNLGISHYEAIEMAREKFVNYNTPLISPVLKVLDYYGFTNFIKYKTAIQKQVLLSFKNSPIQATGIVSLQLAGIAMKIKNPFFPSSYLFESILTSSAMPSGLIRDDIIDVLANTIRYNNII